MYRANGKQGCVCHSVFSPTSASMQKHVQPWGHSCLALYQLNESAEELEMLMMVLLCALPVSQAVTATLITVQ